MPGKVFTIPNVGFHKDHQPRLKKEYQVKPGAGVAIKGDGHGNWRNILLDAEMHGMVTLSDQQREYFNTFYNRPVNKLTRNDIVDFFNQINSLKFTKKIAYKLLGDLLADRGQCDFFMLLLILKMKRDGIDLTILLSNHDLEFLKILSQIFPEKKIYDLSESEHNPPRGFYDTGIDFDDQDASLQALGYLLNKGLITREELNNVIPTYLDSLKLIDYHLSSDKKSIALISHAPCSVQHYARVANYLGIKDFDDSTAEKLSQSINTINQKYIELLKNKDARALNALDPSSLLHPLIWSRWNDDKITNPAKHKAKLDSFQPKHNGYSVFYLHGHDGPTCVPADKRSFVRSLDSHFAKKGINQLGELMLFNWDGGTLEFQEIAANEAIESKDALKKSDKTPKSSDLKPEKEAKKENLLKKPEKAAKSPDLKLAEAVEHPLKKTDKEIALSDKKSLKNPTPEEINKRLENLTAMVSKNVHKYEIVAAKDKSDSSNTHIKTISVKKPQTNSSDNVAESDTKYVVCGTFTYNALTNSSSTDPTKASPEVYDGMLDALDLNSKKSILVTARNGVDLDSLKQAFMQAIKKGYIPRLSVEESEKSAINENDLLEALEAERKNDELFDLKFNYYKSQIAPKDDVSKKLSTLGFLADSDKTDKKPVSPINVDDLNNPFEI